MAANLSFIRESEEPPGQGDDLLVSERLVTACCYDFVATTQEQQRKLRLDSTLQLTGRLYLRTNPELWHRAPPPGATDRKAHRRTPAGPTNPTGPHRALTSGSG